MSRRLTVLNVILRRGIRPFVGRTGRPEDARRHLALSTRLFLHGPRVPERDVRIAGVRCREFLPGSPGEGTILYFHGGAYVAGSPETHRAMLSALAVESGLRVLAPDYRLAPEHPFPAAFEDAAAVADTLDPAQTILGGDSAGGGLALSLLAHQSASGRRPAGCFAFSPWTDLGRGSASLEENAAIDVILPVTRIGELIEMVLAGGDPSDPRISPCHANFAGGPPVHLEVGLTEVLRDDTLRLAKRLTSQGVSVELKTLPHAPHVWQMLTGIVPEARASLRETAAFAKACLSPDRRRGGS